MNIFSLKICNVRVCDGERVTCLMIEPPLEIMFCSGMVRYSKFEVYILVCLLSIVVVDNFIVVVERCCFKFFD